MQTKIERELLMGEGGVQKYTRDKGKKRSSASWVVLLKGESSLTPEKPSVRPCHQTRRWEQPCIPAWEQCAPPHTAWDILRLRKVTSQGSSPNHCVFWDWGGVWGMERGSLGVHPLVLPCPGTLASTSKVVAKVVNPRELRMWPAPATAWTSANASEKV